MKARLDYPDLETRGMVEVILCRRDLRSLLRALDVRSFGQPGLVTVDEENDLVVLVAVVEDVDHD